MKAGRGRKILPPPLFLILYSFILYPLSPRLFCLTEMGQILGKLHFIPMLYVCNSLPRLLRILDPFNPFRIQRPN